MKMKKLRMFLYMAACLMLAACLLASCGGGNKPTETAAETDAPTNPATQEETNMNTDTPTAPVTDPESVTEAPTEAPTDPETVTETETEGETEPEIHEVRLYSLMPGSDALMNSFVIRTAHGKLIVIDGGCDGGGHLDAKAYMPSALRAIAGVGQNDYVEVEAWFLSHAHKDHFNELRKTLDEYTDDENFVIKNFYFDFPDYETPEYPSANGDSPYLEKLKDALNHYAEVRGIPVAEGSTYYEDLNGTVINKKTIEEGFEMTIDGIRIEFMYTWDKSNGGSINDNSLIMRVWVDGQSILLLGDAAVAEGNALVQKYGDQLKSDIVQMAHHGQGGVSKLCYDRIDAAVRIWSTPLWVWNNPNTYAIEDTRQWVNGGKDFTTASEWDIVTCLYAKYPAQRNRVAAWEQVIDGMYITLPYASVATAPDKEEPKPDDPTPDEPPIEHDYVSDGLVSMYLGGKDNTWVDVIGPHDVELKIDDRNYVTAEGLYLDSVRQYFPQAIVDLVNSEEFTVEMTMKDFTPLGTTYNTFMNSSDDAFALFRQCDGSNDFLMMKWAGKPAAVRPKTENGMLELLTGESTLSLTFKVGGAVTIYVNGECVATYETVDSLMYAGDLYIGHDQSSRNYKALFTSVRFYNKALTAEQIKANAAIHAPGYVDPSVDTVYKSENPVNFLGTFTNFDSAHQLTTSSGSYACGGSVTGDMFLSEGATGNTVTAAASASLAPGKGYNGSNAVQISATGNSNQAIYFFATEENKNTTTYANTDYLRVWVDFTDMDFRKATFGLVTADGDLYSVGEKNGAYTPFYYLPEGETEWQELAFGPDGCFGQQEDPPVKNFKGWMAFPTSDFLYWTGIADGKRGDVFSDKEIAGVYMFWCYAQNEDHKNKPFYLDELQLVKDYTVFEAYKAQ